jgi:hypothetical protein
MVGKDELRSYQDVGHERWASRNLVLGSILAGALLVMAVAGSTMALKPHVDLTDNSGISEISASEKPVPGGLSAFLSAFELMSKASDQLPVPPEDEQAF